MSNIFKKAKERVEAITGGTKTIQRAGMEATSKVNFYIVDKQTGEVLEAYSTLKELLKKY